MKKVKLNFEEQILLNSLIIEYETKEAIEKFILEDLILIKNDDYDDDMEKELREMLIPDYNGILEFFEKENITTEDLKNMEFEFKSEDFQIPEDFYLDEAKEEV